MDGLEATSAIRAREKKIGGHIPIIAMTAYAMKGDRERCLSSGMDGYLAKPIRPDELYATIGSLPARIAQAAPFDGAAILKPFLNWDEALEHVGGDPLLLRELISLFVIECPRWMVALRDGLSRGDAKLVCAAAHPLKGSLGTFAASGAQEFALQLETMAREGQLTGGMNALAELERELNRLLPAFREFAKAGALRVNTIAVTK
jgi:CheY-like chemotaxis protein